MLCLKRFARYTGASRDPGFCQMLTVGKHEEALETDLRPVAYFLLDLN